MTNLSFTFLAICGALLFGLVLGVVHARREAHDRFFGWYTAGLTAGTQPGLRPCPYPADSNAAWWWHRGFDLERERWLRRATERDLGEATRRLHAVAEGEHTPACNAARGERERAIQAFHARWRKHCLTCGGWGTLGSGAPDHHTGLADVDPCPCTEAGSCPRCGTLGGLTSEARGDTSAGEGPCAVCGWNYNDGLPPPWDCEGCARNASDARAS